MTSGDVLVQLDVLRVTINRPEKRNPLRGSVLAAIGEAFRVHEVTRSCDWVLSRPPGTRALRFSAA